MSRAERAKEYFKNGYNCSQAVVLAFADLMGLDETTLLKIAQPFGGGLGRLRLTCGAISGMALVVGALKADPSLEGKKNTYAIVQTLCEKFKQECGSLLCGELLAGANVKTEIGGEAEARTAEYYKKRPCADIVHLAASILEEYLQNESEK